MKKWLISLFCRHKFVKVGWFESTDGNVRFSMRKYRCKRCGKERWVDGRNDRFDRIQALNEVVIPFTKN